MNAYYSDYNQINWDYKNIITKNIILFIIRIIRIIVIIIVFIPCFKQTLRSEL